jgi:hypothetical protein
MNSEPYRRVAREIVAQFAVVNVCFINRNVILEKDSRTSTVAMKSLEIPGNYDESVSTCRPLTSAVFSGQSPSGGGPFGFCCIEGIAGQVSNADLFGGSGTRDQAARISNLDSSAGRYADTCIIIQLRAY